MARPTTTQTVAVNADGNLLIWIDGELFGDAALLDNVRRAARFSLSRRFVRGAPMIIANLHEPLGATAALLYAYPGRTTVLEAPSHVLAVFAAATAEMATGSEQTDADHGVIHDV